MPTAIRAQVQRALNDSAGTSVLPAGFTLEGRVQSTATNRPFAVDDDLQVISATDENGRDLPVTPRSSLSTARPIGASLDNGPRWVLPGSRTPAGQAAWTCYGLDRLPRRLSRVSGVAVGYIVSASEQRDLGLSQDRGAAQLIPGLAITIRSVRRDGDAITIQTLLEKTGTFSGSPIEAPRIVGAKVLDQRGAPMGEVSLLAASLIPPTPGSRAYPMTLSMFLSGSTQRPTTLRLQIATRIERVEVPFEFRDLPVADAR